MKLPELINPIADLQLAKKIAIRNKNANSLVTAKMAQAKLLGLDKGDTMTDPAQPVKINIHKVDARRYTENDIECQADGSFFIKPIKAV